MLDATEDGNDERPTSSRREGSPKTIKADVGDRMVYKLVKVGDDGSVLAATEDELFQSLIGGLDNGLSLLDPDVSDAIEDDENKEGSDDLASDGDDSSVKASIIPIQDLVVERQKLKAQIEVLDCILMRVDIEEQRRLFAEKVVVEPIGCREGNCSTYVNAGEGYGDYKRQRRPNPKYFDYDAGDDSLMGPSLSGEPIPIHISLRKPRRSVVVISPRVTSGWGSHRKSGRTGASHRTRAAVSQKPFIQTLGKVASTCTSGRGMSIVSKEVEVSLDNLSIRELHEAFCSTYGRETSVKDKHWLKRQISIGWMMRQQDVVIRSSSQQQVQHKLKARLDQIMEVEQLLPTVAPVNARDIERDVANEAHVQRASEVEHFRDAFKNMLGSTCFQRRVTTPAVLSRGGSFGILSTGCLNGSGAAVGQTTIYGEVVNNGEVVEGKRQRKPNRRYIEDEALVASEFVPIHDTRSFYGETECDGLNSTTNYSWRTVKTDGSTDIIGRHGVVRGSTMQNVFSKKFSPIQRPKFISIGMKRKVGGRAAKLVKMAHSTARATRQDVEEVIRKAKFRLPAIPDVETVQNGIPEMNGEPRERASNLIHIVQFDSLAVAQPLVLDSRGESEHAIVTVPTANGGTRRKHHRPWTLREVMKLVEGVARCGGGKWADIKKLAFSTVGYRTAVDLKDKWRNLLRASRAQLHPAKQGERKKQFTAAIPAPILARVRELASLPNQISSSTVSSSSTSRSGRIIHRK